MESIDNIQQYQLYVDVIKSSSGDLVFYDENGVSSSIPKNDFWLPIFLTRSSEIFEYVQVFKDDKILSIERQEINPYFIELSFFDTIKKHKVLSSSDLSVTAINFIKKSRIELTNSSNQEILEWFDNIGVNELPWFKGTDSEVTADTLDELDVIGTQTISKANYFNIDINK